MPNIANNPKDFSPLSSTAVHVLMVLSDRSHHGYDILKEIQQTTGAKARLSTGTLYNAIHRLLKARLIMVVVNKELQSNGTSDKNKTDGPQFSRYYQITGLGQRTLEAELRRMDEIARATKQQPALEGLSTIWGDTV